MVQQPAPPDNLSFDTVSDFINNTHKIYKKGGRQ